VTSFGGLVACRIVIGAFEAGLFPGCIYLLSMYYKTWELQRRVVAFFSASILAGSFGGLFAYAIGNLGGQAGKAAWQYVFIVEGSITVIIAIASKFMISDFPEDNKWLTTEERAMVIARLRDDHQVASLDRLTMAKFLYIMRDWKIYCAGWMYLFCVTTSYSIALFLPTLLKNMGYTAIQAQLLSIGPYAAAFVATCICAYLSDHTQHRYSFCMLGAVVSVCGYIIIMATPSNLPGVSYFATFLMIVGAYIAQPLILTWAQNTVLGHYKRSVASAWVVSFGNISGIIASTIYTTPPYTTPYAIGLSFMVAFGICSTIFWYFLRRENRKRDRGERDDRLQDMDIGNKGDDHPAFRFAL